MTDLCPHCGERWDGHVCADTAHWSQPERDAARALMRRRHPAIVFAPSTQQMQSRFGARNRADREAAA